MMRVIFLLLVSSIALQSKSQTWNNYLQKRFKSYGIWADSILLVPNDTSLNKTGFAIKGSTAYIGDGTKWTALTTDIAPVDTSIISTKDYVNYKDDIQQGFIDMRKLDADSIAWTGYATRARLYKVSDSISDKLNNKLNASAVSLATGQVAFGSGTNTIGGDNGLYWDNSNKRLGIGTTTPSEKLDVDGYVLASGFKSGALTKSTFATGLSTPVGLAFDASGNLYVSNFSGTTVDKITPGGTKSTFATGLSGPYDLIFDTSGNLYVSNGSGTTIDKITPGGVKSTFVTGLTAPRKLVFDASGNLYVSNFSGTTVDKITPGGTKSTFVSGLSAPFDLVFDASGNLYVSNFSGTTVDKITPGGTKSTFASGLSAPFDLVFDASGNLYVSNFSGTTVDKITPGGTKSTFATGLSIPYGLIFDTSGNLYVSNYGGTTVDKITPRGTKSTIVTGLSTPFDLVFDTSANLYIANRGGTTVEKITMGSLNSFLKGDGTTDATIYLSGAGVLGRIPFYSGANTLTSNSGLFWDNVNSRLGLGTTTPSEKLHVVGNGLFTGTLKVGAYTLPATDGTANQVLKTDGSGTLSWQNDSGIALTSLSATTPLSYNNGTGVFSISQANTSTNGYLSSTDWNTFNNKANTITEITKLELDSLITVNGLKTGQFYKISGVHPTLYGGTTIIMQAESTNKLVAQGHGIFYNPKYDEDDEFKGIWNQGFMLGTFDSVSGNFDYINKETVTADNGATGKVYAKGFIKWVSGDWSSVSSITGNSSAATADVSGFTTPTYSINSMVVWGGRVYKNKLGNLGNDEGNSPIDNGEWYSLNSSDWEVVGYNDETYYTKVIDVIRYDYDNDLIFYRADNKGNEVECNIKDILYFDDNYTGINAIQVFQWGRETEDAYTGVFNNKISVNSFADIINNYGQIYNNTLTNGGYIYNNTLTNGEIYNNTLTNSSISYNTLTNSSIYYNTLTNSSISYNTLTNSSIYNNTLTNSSISYNTLTNYSSIHYNTLTNGSEISMGTSNTLSNKNIQYNNFIRGSILNVSLSSATLVFGDFEKTIYKRPDGTTKLRYYNNSDVLTIADITD